DGFFVVHRHAREGLANIASRGERIRLAIRPFRIDVDQAHLYGGEGILKIAVALISLVRQPLAFGTPVDVGFGLPDIRASAAETESLAAHRLERDIARENDEVGPGDLPAVFLFDRP